MTTPRTDWRPGQVVAGIYTIVKELGRGGMGVVHLAREGQAGRLVAIKSPQGDFFNDALARRRYAREATAWLELGSHPHIVRAFDVQEVDYLPRIVMAYCDGGALTNLIAQHPRGLPFQQVYDIAAQICWGLDYAHQHGLVHRDLKPDNVLLHTEDGRVTAKVTDFGLVRPAGAVTQDTEGANGFQPMRQAELTGGQALGTPLYMAPEQWQGGTVGPAADVYALGLIVFELLTGQRAFDVRTHPFCRGMDIAPGMQVGFYRLLHQQQEPLDAMALRADLPAGVWRLVRECLAKRPEARPEGARAVALRLARELSVVGMAATWRVEAGQDERDGQGQREHGWALVRLGNGAQSRGDLAEAQQSYERAQAIFAALGDKEGLAGCYQSLGNVQKNRGIYDEAVRWYEQATVIQREIGDHKGLAGCYQGLGIVHRNRGAYHEAVRLFEQAIAIQREIDDRAGLASCYGNLGIVHRNRGAYHEAVRQYEQAIAIFREIGDRAGLSTCYQNLGVVFEARGAYDEAVRQYEQAIAIKREIGDRQGLSMCYANLANLNVNRGAYDDAVRWYGHAIVIMIEIGDQSSISRCYRNIGIVQRDRGRYHEAMQAFQRAIQIMMDINDRVLLATTCQNLGDLHLNHGNYRDARVLYEKAIPIKQEVNDYAGLSDCFQNLGVIHVNSGQHSEAELMYERAIAVKREIGDRKGLAGCCVGLGTVHLYRSANDEAVWWYEQAMEIYREIGDRAGLSDCYQNLGIVFEKRAQAAEAVRHYQACLQFKCELGLPVPDWLEPAIRRLGG